jgi:glycosyltransferase involved in cell wall biosynthesis
MKISKVSVIIATMNEEDAISKVIKRIPKSYEIVVVDKSKDNTPEIARSLGANVIIQKDKGKGRAMILGAEKASGDIIVFIDGDNTYPPEKIPDMVKLIEQGKADAVNAVRNFKNMKRSHVIGNKILSLVASSLHSKTSDLLTGMRAMRRSNFLDLGLKSVGFEIETEIFVRSSKKKLKTAEIPIEYHERIGEAKLNSVRDGWKILKMLLKNVF